MKIYILFIAVVFFLCSCTAEENDGSLKSNESEQIALIGQLSDLPDDGTKYINENDDTSIEYTIDVPESYHKIYNGQQTFLYDSNGNDLCIFKGSPDSKFNEYQQNNYSQLTDKAYDNIKLRGFKRINIDGREAIRIKYTGEKENIEYMVCCYYINDETEMIKSSV